MCSLWNRLSAKCLAAQRTSKNCTWHSPASCSGDPSRGRATRVGPEPDGGGREEAGAVHEQQRRPGRSRHIRNLPPSPPGAKTVQSILWRIIDKMWMIVLWQKYFPRLQMTKLWWLLQSETSSAWQNFLVAGGVRKEDHRHGWRLRWRLASFWQGRKRKVIW